MNFHQTFKPEREHISSLLSIGEIVATKEELSQRLFIPTGKKSGKVEVNLLYARAAGLLNFTKKNDFYAIERTDLGNLIMDNDSFLEHEITQIYIHYMFCTKYS